MKLFNSKLVAALLTGLVTSNAFAEIIKYDPNWKQKTFGWVKQVESVDKFDQSQEGEAFILSTDKSKEITLYCETGNKPRLEVSGGFESSFNSQEIERVEVMFEDKAIHRIALEKTASRTWAIYDPLLRLSPMISTEHFAIRLMNAKSLDVRFIDSAGSKEFNSFPIIAGSNNLKQVMTLCS